MQQFFLKMDHSQPPFHLFSSFLCTGQLDKFSSQQELNSGHRSRNPECWPLDHHHGPKPFFIKNLPRSHLKTEARPKMGLGAVAWSLCRSCSPMLNRRSRRRRRNMFFPIPAISCPTPNNPENGRAVFASVSYNSLISYECNYGYMIVGDQVNS